MRKLLVLSVLLGCLCAPLCAQDCVYAYKVRYKLGLIEADIASCSVRTSTSGSDFSATLQGSSIPWGGRVYSVYDRLEAVMEPSASVPGVRERVVSQLGVYSKPTEKELQAGTYDASDPDNYRSTDGAGLLDASAETMEAVRMSVDMLAMFYIFAHADFDSLEPYRPVLMPITQPDGSVLYADLTNQGRDFYNGRQVWKVNVEYYYDGAPSGYPISCFVDADTREPLMLAATLKIGHMQMELDN